MPRGAPGSGVAGGLPRGPGLLQIGQSLFDGVLSDYALEKFAMTDSQGKLALPDSTLPPGRWRVVAVHVISTVSPGVD